MKLNSLYVSCTNLNRATNWYRQHLVNREPDNQTDRFIFWKLGEVHFGLFDANAVDEAIYTATTVCLILKSKMLMPCTTG